MISPPKENEAAPKVGTAPDLGQIQLMDRLGRDDVLRRRTLGPVDDIELNLSCLGEGLNPSV